VSGTQHTHRWKSRLRLHNPTGEKKKCYMRAFRWEEACTVSLLNMANKPHRQSSRNRMPCERAMGERERDLQKRKGDRECVCDTALDRNATW
jgi:hypothetical protein